MLSTACAHGKRLLVPGEQNSGRLTPVSGSAAHRDWRLFAGWRVTHAFRLRPTLTQGLERELKVSPVSQIPQPRGKSPQFGVAAERASAIDCRSGHFAQLRCGVPNSIGKAAR